MLRSERTVGSFSCVIRVFKKLLLGGERNGKEGVAKDSIKEQNRRRKTGRKRKNIVRKWRFNSASAHHRTGERYKLDSSSISVIRAPRFQARKPSYQTSVEPEISQRPPPQSCVCACVPRYRAFPIRTDLVRFSSTMFGRQAIPRQYRARF